MDHAEEDEILESSYKNEQQQDEESFTAMMELISIVQSADETSQILSRSLYSSQMSDPECGELFDFCESSYDSISAMRSHDETMNTRFEFSYQSLFSLEHSSSNTGSGDEEDDSPDESLLLSQDDDNNEEWARAKRKRLRQRHSKLTKNIKQTLKEIMEDMSNLDFLCQKIVGERAEDVRRLQEMAMLAHGMQPRDLALRIREMLDRQIDMLKSFPQMYRQLLIRVPTFQQMEPKLTSLEELSQKLEILDCM